MPSDKRYDPRDVRVIFGDVVLKGLADDAIVLREVRYDIPTKARRAIGSVSGSFSMVVRDGADDLLGALNAIAHHERLVWSARRRRKLAARREVDKLQALLEARRYGRRLPRMLALAEAIGARQRQAETARDVFGGAMRNFIEGHIAAGGLVKMPDELRDEYERAGLIPPREGR